MDHQEFGIMRRALRAVRTNDTNTLQLLLATGLIPDGTRFKAQLRSFAFRAGHEDIMRLFSHMRVFSGVPEVGNQPHAFEVIDGTLFAWGWNEFGQLGVGDHTPRAERSRVMGDVRMVVVGGYHALALKSDGTVWGWGRNRYGELGNGHTVDSPHPIWVLDDVVDLTAGASHVLAVKADGTLWAWGSNHLGQLGDGTLEDRHRPVRVMGGVLRVAAGKWHSVAVRSSGSVWTWGANKYGELGFGRGVLCMKPTRVLRDGVHASAGDEHTVVVTKDGTLWGWGSNLNGQLALVRKRGGAWWFPPEARSPRRIMRDVMDVSAGSFHTLAVKRDGTLVGWGQNRFGQVNTRSSNEISEPHVIAANVTRAFASGLKSFAARADGDWWALNDI